MPRPVNGAGGGRLNTLKRCAKLLLSLVLIVSLAVIFFRVRDQRRAARDSAEAARIAGLDEPDQSENSVLPEVIDPPGESSSSQEEEPPEPLPEEAAALAELDLASLQDVNEDVLGWIEIPGTQLSYPLVQGTDNQFYLSHNWKKEANGGGSVFLEQTNNRDLSGFHLIAYAHRMRNDTMFGTLKYYKDPDFCRQHPSIYLVDGTTVRRYDVFAVHKAPVRSLVYRLDLETNHLEDEFIQFCLDSSLFETGVVPESGAQVLTLSTCTGEGYDSRLVVQGTLVRQYDMTG